MRKLIPIIIFLLMVSIGFSANTVYTCLDTNTSQANVTIYNATDDTVLIALSENITCKFGCNNETGKCEESEVDLADVGILLGLPLLAFIFIYMANHTTFKIPIKGYHINPLEYLFFSLAFFMIMIDAGVILRLTRTSSQTAIHNMFVGGYAGIMWGGWVTLAVIMIYFIYMVFTHIIRLGKIRR